MGFLLSRRWVLACLAGFGALGQGPGALAQSAEPAARAAVAYTNPVWDADFPDPTVIHARDGYYYAYGTQGAHNGRPLNLQVARSADLVHWTHLGDALPVKPTWAHTTYSFWAPHVSEAGGTYYLYFSAKPDAETSPGAGDGLCLGVATAASPAGPFTATGDPLQCGPGFVNIDPMEFDDPATGKHLLYWGSGFGALKVRELAADRLSFAPGSAPLDLVGPDPTDRPGNYRRLVEGSWVVLRHGWYYLFFSGDNCCGDRAHYAVLVARSRAATGPFEVRAEPVLARNAQWRAPGHNSVVTDAAGHDWMAYHALHAGPPAAGSPPNTGRVLLLDRLEYVGGWPRVVPDGTPSVGPQPAPAAAR